MADMPTEQKWDQAQQQALRYARRIEAQGGIPKRCFYCRESHPSIRYEKHHLAGRANADQTVWACRNCHDKLTDKQQDWPEGLQAHQPKTKRAILAAKLSGLADSFQCLTEETAKTLQELSKDILTEKGEPATDERP